MKKEELSNILKIEEKRKEVERIEKEMSIPDFWSDQNIARKLSQRLTYINNIIDDFDKADSEEELSKLENEAMFSDETDSNPAILSVHAGAGGTEAQDWAQMLMRMYMRFAENKSFSIEMLDESKGEEVGIKSAAIKIDGVNAYGNFKGEAGVHRLVRISPFDADKARHTSFALVEVIPEFDDLEDVEIDDKDLKIDVYRASGHGGQSVNTTDSAVRITHLPTKTVVAVQNERSQLQNKEKAMKILKSRIKKLKLDEQKARDKEIKGEHISAEWGNQIRSYVLQPYQQVKDHRTGYESPNPEAVLGGDLEAFVESYLKHIKK